MSSYTQEVLLKIIMKWSMNDFYYSKRTRKKDFNKNILIVSDEKKDYKCKRNITRQTYDDVHNNFELDKDIDGILFFDQRQFPVFEDFETSAKIFNHSTTSNTSRQLVILFKHDELKTCTNFHTVQERLNRYAHETGFETVKIESLDTMFHNNTNFKKFVKLRTQDLFKLSAKEFEFLSFYNFGLFEWNSRNSQGEMQSGSNLPNKKREWIQAVLPGDEDCNRKRNR